MRRQPAANKLAFAIGQTVVVEIGTSKLIGRVTGVVCHAVDNLQYQVRHLRGEESYLEYYWPQELRTATDEEMGIRRSVGFGSEGRHED